MRSVADHGVILDPVPGSLLSDLWRVVRFLGGEAVHRSRVPALLERLAATAGRWEPVMEVAGENFAVLTGEVARAREELGEAAAAHEGDVADALDKSGQPGADETQRSAHRNRRPHRDQCGCDGVDLAG